MAEFDGNIENEVYIQNIAFAVRPDGSDAVRIDFVFNTPIMPAEKPQQYTVNIGPHTPLTKPKELKATIILSLEEWEKVKDKYQVGQTYTFKVKEGQISIE